MELFRHNEPIWTLPPQHRTAPNRADLSENALLDAHLPRGHRFNRQIVVAVAWNLVAGHAVERADDRKLQRSHTCLAWRHSHGEFHAPEDLAVGQVHGGDPAEGCAAFLDESIRHLPF